MAKTDKIIVRHCSHVLLTTRINQAIREVNKLRDEDNNQNPDEYWRKRTEDIIRKVAQHSFAYLVPV